ncbi:hypothetical protein LTR17_027172, partial [Elasticomyces elasticus]
SLPVLELFNIARFDIGCHKTYIVASGLRHGSAEAVAGAAEVAAHAVVHEDASFCGAKGVTALDMDIMIGLTWGGPLLLPKKISGADLVYSMILLRFDDLTQADISRLSPGALEAVISRLARERLRPDSAIYFGDEDSRLKWPTRRLWCTQTRQFKGRGLLTLPPELRSTTHELILCRPRDLELDTRKQYQETQVQLSKHKPQARYDLPSAKTTHEQRGDY